MLIYGKRDFIYTNASGDVELYPFVTYSYMNLTKVTFKESLQSNFLRKIRENQDKLYECSGSCALWQNRDWIQSLLNENKYIFTEI